MSEFISNVLKLISGSIIAQIIAIGLIPIITRLYTPEDYGLFSLILAISGIIVVFSSLSYQLAIMLPKEDVDAAHIVILCCILIMISSIFTGIIFIFFGDFIANILNVPKISNYLLFVPIIVFFTAIVSVFTYWNARRKRFGTIALAQSSNSFLSKIIQIGAGIGSASLFGLITGYFIGYISAITFFLKGFFEDFILFKKISRQRLKSLAIRYKKFPLFTSWSTTANTISIQIAPLLLVYFYSPVIVGYYTIANQVVQMPMSLIGSAIGQVFFQRASEDKNKTDNISEIVHGVHRRLVSFGIFPMLLLLIIGEDLFALALGTEWATAGLYVKILVPWLLLVFIASPLSTIFSVLERQHIDLSFNVTLLISRIGVLCIGGVLFDPIGTLILYSITGIFFWGWLNMYLLEISNIPYKDGLIDYLRYFTYGSVIAVPLILLKLFYSQSVYLLVIVGILSLIFYYIIIFNQDPLLKGFIIEVFRGVKDGN